MKSITDWSCKLSEAIGRLQKDYDYIGRTTGAPFLAIIYPHDAEIHVYKEWKAQASALKNYDVRTIDVLEVTMNVVNEIGLETIVDTISDHMPGSNPENDLADAWVSAVVKTVHDNISKKSSLKPIIVLINLAALYPVAGPYELMQKLWETEQSTLDCPIVFLIPGTLKEPRVYSFLNKRIELMYRGLAL